ncbi:MULTISPECIES: ester cyclase [unclassified Ruegeria]|uniref:ester cyclase n=1 Tax=unclassified Ruegeria TaxID=2625375 RepID=UPI001AD9FDD2|nr:MULTISPECIES: ester cyclase [unclassified Ruegeria]MBO9411952.1 ester cyclase [Ruegeria sp. R8_1]MBO9417061.1 ester cyclase [Ruegeria sp. R8_2]
MSDPHTQHKTLIAPIRAAMYDFTETGVRQALAKVSAPDTLFRLCHPFGDSTGSDAFYETAYKALLDAWPDLERRDYIVMAGPDEHGADWVGCGGYYTGTFTGPWLDIPPTGHQVTMRFHEFYRISDGQIVEMQALWDIPEVMMQANAWPMAPSLGREWHVPGPATQDGLVPGPYDAAKGQQTCQHIIDMLDHLKKHPSEGGPEVMEMEKFWHPRMNWYGPSGIGTGRGMAGFRNWHQIPFLNGMPDRGQYVDDITYHFFGDGDYAAVTGWPNMIQTVTHDGWMGIAPSGKRITMRSLDFWRVEKGKIRENWVLVDLLDAYRQLGVDVFARLREFNKARNMGRIAIPDGMN